MQDKDYMLNKIDSIVQYQECAQKTAIYSCPDYPFAGLAEEVGEVMGKLAKYGRKNDLTICGAVRAAAMTGTGSTSQELRDAVIKELGDVAWMWALCCKELNVNPSEVLYHNIQKLRERSEKGTLEGSGDNR